MRILLASAVVTAALAKGVMIGIVIGTAAATCARCASQGCRRESRNAAVAEEQGEAKGRN